MSNKVVVNNSSKIAKHTKTVNTKINCIKYDDKPKVSKKISNIKDIQKKTNKIVSKTNNVIKNITV